DGMPGKPLGAGGVPSRDALTSDAYVNQIRSGLVWRLPNHDDGAHLTRAQVLGGLAWARKAAPDRTRITVDTHGTVYVSTGWSAARYIPVSLLADYSADHCPGCDTPYATNGDGPCEGRPAVEVKPGMYARHTGAHGLGWARRVSEENAASVRAAIDAARAKGRRVEVEANGVIKVHDAGVVDLAHADAGKRCPVWYVPQERPAAPEQTEAERAALARPCDGCGAEAGKPCNPHSTCTPDAETLPEGSNEGHGYTWADARQIKARDLKPGDVFVEPGMGTAYHTKSDGTVYGAGIAFAMELDGTAWTVVDRWEHGATSVSHAGTCRNDEIPESARVLRVVEGAVSTLPTLTREPWRGGQVCGHQITCDRMESTYCGAFKAPGLKACQQHHDETAEEYGTVRYAPGNADGVTIVRTMHGWGAYAADGEHVSGHYDDRARLEYDHGFALLWEDEGGEPVEPTEEERAALAGGVDDATPLDEMGTDDLLTVLRENVADIPKGSVFAEAWALMD
ncbi:hypothetical protein ACFRBW_39325, partial [Streptomyces sp. NPDC056670]